jgi:hypothetical protein
MTLLHVILCRFMFDIIHIPLLLGYFQLMSSPALSRSVEGVVVNSALLVHLLFLGPSAA